MSKLFAPRYRKGELLQGQRCVMTMKTEILLPTEDGLARAAAIFHAQGLVAMPTETVYGLAADARSDLAVAAVFAAKNRPHFNPLIVHLPDLAAVHRYATVPPEAEMLAAAFWPGPLTMVLPLRADAGLSPLVTAGLSTVAIRVPAHPVARDLLQVFGGPLAAPSANPSGRTSPTRAAHVLAGLGGRIAAVLEGGACAVGVESTILALDGHASLLRPGGVAVEDIERILGHAVLLPTDPATPKAPGQLASHYAPEAAVRLNVTSPRAGEVYVGFGSQGALTLSAGADLIEAAANLFHILREADALAGPNGAIAFAPIPETGLGRAINDRLRRAAAPRP